MILLDRPRTTNTLAVLVTGAIVIGTAAAIGQTLTLVVGLASVVLFTASGRMFGRNEFSYRWLIGQALALVACVFLVAALAGAVVFADMAYSGVGVALSIASALALFGGAAIVTWDVIAGTTHGAIERIYRSLLVSGIVLASITGGAIALAARFGLEHVGVEARLFRVVGIDRLTATDFAGGLIVLLAVTASLYALRSLLSHPAVEELYTQLKYGLGEHPSQRSETLSVETGTTTAAGSATGAESDASDEPDSPDGSDSSRDGGAETVSAEAVQRASKAIRTVPFVHYTPSRKATLGAYLVVFLALVLSRSLPEVLGDPPSKLVGSESRRILQDSVADVIGAVGGSPTLVRSTLELLGVLLIANLAVRLVWRVVKRGWRDYVSGLTWFFVPTLIGTGTSIIAPSILEWLRETPAVHYVPVVEDGVRVVVTDGDVAIREFDPASIAVEVQYDSTMFTDSLALARDVIGAPGVVLAPMTVVVVLAYLTLAVGRLSVWKVVAYRADSAVVGPLLVVMGVVLAAGLGTSAWTALVVTAGAFLLIQLRSLTVQHDRQLPPGAITRRGELAHAAAPAVLIAGGVVVAGVGTIGSLRRMAAALPEWRLLVGAVVTFGVVFLSLLSLALTSE